MSKDNSSLTLLQLNNYVKPKIEENKQKGYVTNGRNNDYFEYVNNRYIGSPTNSAILNGYKSWVYGKGLAAKDQHLKTAQYARLYSILKKKDIRRVVADFVIHNMAYIQIIRNRDNSLSSIKHIAVDKIAPQVADENNEIGGYFFSNDFSKTFKPENKPEFIQAFGSKKTYAAIEILCIKPYQMGRDYFSLPSYQSGLQYAELEEEISNYSISHMKNGLSFGYIISIPNSYNLSAEDKRKVRKSIEDKTVGSTRAGTFMIDFSNGEIPITVTPLEVNDAHKQWEFLSQESRDKIITSHEVVSPMLFGIKDASGFSSNADELAESERQTIERVVNPKQDYIIDAFEDVLQSDGITLDLFFKPLSERKEPIKDVTKTELSTQVCCSSEGVSEGVADALISLGESFDDSEWDILSEQEVNYETDDDIYDLINLSLASTGTARPNSKSSQDSENIVIRYKYVGNPNPQREFCKKMVSAAKVYRKEDIISMQSKSVNAGFGIKGANTYDIWLYKGSVQCKHKWNRVIYLKKNGGVDINSQLAQAISTSEARRRGYKVPNNNSLVSIAPNKMPNGGAYPK